MGRVPAQDIWGSEFNPQYHKMGWGREAGEGGRREPKSVRKLKAVSHVNYFVTLRSSVSDKRDDTQGT